EPENVDVEGLLHGIHLVAPATASGTKAQLLASGVAMQWALEAQELLAKDWNVSADVWSVTSWTELRRDGLDAQEHNLLHPNDAGTDSAARSAPDSPPTARPAPRPSPRNSETLKGPASVSATTCTRGPTRSGPSCPATTRLSAPTVTASPTRAPRPDVTSPS